MAHNNGMIPRGRGAAASPPKGFSEASAEFRAPGVTTAVARAPSMTPAEMAAFVPHRPARPEKSEGGKRFVLVSEYEPAGDQPTAIKELVEQARAGERDQCCSASPAPNPAPQV